MLGDNSISDRRKEPMAKKDMPPSIKETAFDCPHCGAYTTQHWFKLHASAVEGEHPTPFIPDEDMKNAFLKDKNISDEARSRLLKLIEKIATGLVFLEKTDSKTIYRDANNLCISECYNCKKVSVWVHNNLVFPSQKHGVQPNPDLPDDIVRDFEEARAIVGLSPRGSAALLRLCIQKLCVHLNEKGKNIDDDIASLVAKGLNPLIQKSLDIIRVIGNEAVHPGVIDLKDDRDTANELFVLINSIADQMITHPNNVEKLYQKLPESKRKAIEQRDEKAKK